METNASRQLTLSQKEKKDKHCAKRAKKATASNVFRDTRLTLTLNASSVHKTITVLMVKSVLPLNTVRFCQAQWRRSATSAMRDTNSPQRIWNASDVLTVGTVPMAFLVQNAILKADAMDAMPRTGHAAPAHLDMNTTKMHLSVTRALADTTALMETHAHLLLIV